MAGAPVLENLHRFLVFTLVTSSLGWDTGRAITNLAAILLLGPAVLVALRRAARRAAFDAPVDFTPSRPLAARSINCRNRRTAARSAAENDRMAASMASISGPNQAQPSSRACAETTSSTRRRSAGSRSRRT